MPRTVALVGLLAAGPSGVARYATALIRALDEVSSDHPALALRLLTTSAATERLGPLRMDVETLPLRTKISRSGPGRIMLEQWRAAASHCDLLHFFDLTGPLLRPRRPFVATVHDASVMHGYSVVRQAYKRRLYPWALRRARATVAVSDFARSEAIRHFGTPPREIRVIRSGPGFTPTRAADAPARDLGLDGSYFLYVGNLTASKNLPFLVRAFDRSGATGTLVLAGRPGERYSELEAALRSTSGDIRIVDDASDADLDALYRGATALLLPSRYEGFAFTPLEAMARGCPVLASDIPAVREISGGGARLLPVDDEAAWAEALRDLEADPAGRDELASRGARHVAGYSWTATATRLCSLFETVEV